MNKKSLAHKIDCKTAAREALLSFADDIRDEIGGLKAQLAEAEEPKLGHWDLGIDDEGRGFVVVSQDTLPGSPKAFFEDSGGLIEADRRMSPDTRISNLKEVFADLKAMQDDLTRFMVYDKQNERKIEFVASPGNLYVSLQESSGERHININIPLDRTVLDLRSMEATLKRQKNS